MPNRKIGQLPNYSGNTSGVHLVMNNSANSTTFTVTKETLLDGNNTFHGDQIISGSLIISGSQTRYGNTKNLGQWELTGSMYVSGSNSIVGDTYIGGNTTLNGNISVSGSFTGSMNIKGNVNVISGSAFYRWGNKLFNYANFYSTTTQSGSANTAYPIVFNTIGETDGFTIVSGSRITATNTGIYDIRLATKLQANENNSCLFSFWINFTGSILQNTLSQINIPKEPGGGSTLGSQIDLIKMNAGDYFEVMYSKTTDLGTLQYITGQTSPTRPNGPSARILIAQLG